MAHRSLTALAAVLLVTTALAATAAPPPWAPAHGYRYRNLDGLEIVYDAHHDLWEVLTIAGLYYLEGRYWRRVRDHWEWSDRHDGGWRGVRPGREPGALRDLRAPDDRRDDHRRGPPRHPGGGKHPR